MLPGTCDACQQMMPFDEHLAGRTVRCKRCGRGWVRFPASTGITASVPVFAGKGPTGPPDTAITAQRPIPDI
jgi:hypothetical protein